MEENVLKISRFVSASREKVFRAWTVKEEMEKWYGPEGMTSKVLELELAPGGKYRIAMTGADGQVHTVHGIFKEVLPPEKVSFSWQWEGADTGMVGAEETMVTVELREKDGGTEVMLTHSGFSKKEGMQAHDHGWSSQLNKLGKI